MSDSDNNQISSASIMSIFAGILYLFFNIINERFIKKEQLTKVIIKGHVKNTLLVILCCFITIYFSSSITTTIIDTPKPGVIIDEPSF
jgi:hypothetical protein